MGGTEKKFQEPPPPTAGSACWAAPTPAKSHFWQFLQGLWGTILALPRGLTGIGQRRKCTSPRICLSPPPPPPGCSCSDKCGLLVLNFATVSCGFCSILKTSSVRRKSFWHEHLITVALTCLKRKGKGVCCIRMCLCDDWGRGRHSPENG